MAYISVLTQASESVLQDINRLTAQLRKESNTPGTLAELEKIVRDDNIRVVIAEDDGKVIGIAFLYIVQKVGKRIAFVEDVVVDETYRGQGIGKEIMSEIVSLSRQKKVAYVSFTSQPSKEGANKFYQKIGFEQRDTNVYRLKL